MSHIPLKVVEPDSGPHGVHQLCFGCRARAVICIERRKVAASLTGWDFTQTIFPARQTLIHLLLPVKEEKF